MPRELTIVTGCPRSGSSMVSSILRHCGSYGSDVIDESIDEVVTHILAVCGADPRGQGQLPNTKTVPQLETFAAQIDTIFTDEAYRHGPRTCRCTKAPLIWPVWAAAFPSAQWVWVRREDSAIVNSCLHTAYMRGRKTAEDWLAWIGEYHTRFKEMEAAGLDVVEVWPDQLFKEGFEKIRVSAKQLKLEWRIKA